MLRTRIFASVLLFVAVSAAAYERPLTFEANRGQFVSGVLYAARGPQYCVAVDRNGATLHLDDATLRLQWIGASAGARIEAIDELAAKSSYFLGNDPSWWTHNIPNYARVRQANVWPGIDAIYYGTGAQLEYDLVAAPGADPSQIALRFRGAQHVALDGDGRLHLRVGGRDVIQNAPVAYQDVAGVRREIDAHYVVDGSRVRFRIGAYDRTRPLVIDPVLVYSTYFGQPGFETYIHSAADAAGNVFITAYPGIKGPSTLQFSPGGGSDISITKFAPDGQTLLFSIYFGGTSLEYPRGLATDLAGNVYVLGWTSSTDFPIVNAVQPVNAGCNELFVSKISADGSQLLYSTYYGGSGCEFGGDDIAVDALGQAVVTAQTNSTDFPVVNAYQPVNTAGTTGVVFKLNAAGNGILFSTYFGSPTSLGDGFGVAADALGNSYVVASTTASDFPTLNATQPALNGARDGWIAKFDPAGALVYSTYFGGSGDDEFYGVAADALGNAYATGITFSSDYPATPGALQTTCGGGTAVPCNDATLTKFDPSGAVVYSSYLGGSGDDEAWDVAIDATGRAVVVGNTRSNNFSLVGATQSVLTSVSCPFVTRVSAAGNATDFSTYHGGGFSGQAYGDEVSVDAAGNIYASGGTTQTDFPTLNALFPTLAGGRDCWIAKFGDVVLITPSPSVLAAKGGANHKLVPVTLAYGDPSASSARLTSSSSPACSVSVMSNEPVNGTGDGDTSPDWIIVDPHHVQLRAERAGNGNGRVYTIKVTCPTASGQTTVSVPKDKK
ncbi:MAG: SBBP repeat-containing protein [Acidobacteria bacterium]|nr:SBBP repeat-containing protein [Acidobacteriota bacterium]MBV9475467.1 SBBP repeat-containing protein [Acidobacteriota bacterium]